MKLGEFLGRKLFEKFGIFNWLMMILLHFFIESWKFAWTANFCEFRISFVSHFCFRSYVWIWKILFQTVMPLSKVIRLSTFECLLKVNLHFIPTILTLAGRSYLVLYVVSLKCSKRWAIFLGITRHMLCRGMFIKVCRDFWMQYGHMLHFFKENVSKSAIFRL